MNCNLQTCKHIGHKQKKIIQPDDLFLFNEFDNVNP